MRRYDCRTLQVSIRAIDRLIDWLIGCRTVSYFRSIDQSID